MLRHKFFHRARRVPVTARDLRGKALKKFQEEQEKLKELERQKADRDKRKQQKSKAGGDAEETKSSGEEKRKSDGETVTKDQRVSRRLMQFLDYEYEYG
jgi:translocation protein SEC62